MDIKSYKLRAVLIIYALIKLSDKNHRMTASEMNKFLKQYGLDYSRQILPSTVELLRTIGLDIQEKGRKRTRGFWIDNYPFTEERIAAINLAVSTNPYISKDYAKEIMSWFKPFVSVYMENMLECHKIDAKNTSEDFEVSAVIQQAIIQNKDIQYRLPSLDIKEECMAPKSLSIKKNMFYISGVLKDNKRVERAVSELYDVVIIQD